MSRLKRSQYVAHHATAAAVTSWASARPARQLSLVFVIAYPMTHPGAVYCCIDGAIGDQPKSQERPEPVRTHAHHRQGAPTRCQHQRIVGQRRPAMTPAQLDQTLVVVFAMRL